MQKRPNIYNIQYLAKYSTNILKANHNYNNKICAAYTKKQCNKISIAITILEPVLVNGHINKPCTKAVHWTSRHVGAIMYDFFSSLSHFQPCFIFPTTRNAACLMGSYNYFRCCLPCAEYFNKIGQFQLSRLKNARNCISLTTRSDRTA